MRQRHSSQRRNHGRLPSGRSRRIRRLPRSLSSGRACASGAFVRPHALLEQAHAGDAAAGGRLRTRPRSAGTRRPARDARAARRRHGRRRCRARGAATSLRCARRPRSGCRPWETRRRSMPHHSPVRSSAHCSTLTRWRVQPVRRTSIPEHVFFALVLAQDSPAGQILAGAGVTPESLTQGAREQMQPAGAPATEGAQDESMLARSELSTSPPVRRRA